MGNVYCEVSIPLDKDCFIEMECDFCKNYFMLHKDVDHLLFLSNLWVAKSN